MQNGIYRLRVHRFEGVSQRLRGRITAAHAKLVDVADGYGRLFAQQNARQSWPERNSAEGTLFALRTLNQPWISGSSRLRGCHCAVQPAIFGAFIAGRSRFHVVLSIEVGACGIGRAGSVNNRQVLLVPQWLERAYRRMQAKETIEIDGAQAAVAGTRNRD